MDEKETGGSNGSLSTQIDLLMIWILLLLAVTMGLWSCLCLCDAVEHRNPTSWHDISLHVCGGRACAGWQLANSVSLLLQGEFVVCVLVVHG